MPIYQYKCDDCKNSFEQMQSMSDAPIRECPKCGETKVRKIFMTGGILGSSKGGQSDPMPPPACNPGMGGGGCAGGMCGL